MTSFTAIFSLAATHAYHGGRCADVEWLVPADTNARLRNGGMLVRKAAGGLHVFAAGDENGAAPAGVAGLRLRFGLRLSHPFFPNYTNLPADFPGTCALYRNAAAPGALDAVERVRLVGPRFSHALAAPTQATAMVLKDGQGRTLKAEQIAADTRTAWTCDLGGAAPGRYTVEETSGGPAVSTGYYVDAELAPAGVPVVMEIAVDAGFWTSAPAFVISFEAREETLKYYVVAEKYPDTEWASLTVADTGAAADGRDVIDFDKVETAAFTAAEIAPGLIGAAGAKVVLFKSHAPVPRTARGRTGLQLKQGAEIVVANLPQPAPDNASANLIVSVAKP